MRAVKLIGLTAGLIAATAATRVETRPLASSDGVLKVRIYNYAHVPAETLQAAVAHSNRIFANATLVTTWHVCAIRQRVDLPDDLPCAGPVGTNEFSVRIVNRSIAGSSRSAVLDVLGYAVISPEHVGAMATILFPRIRELAEHSNFGVAPLLGRVMAHEIGHLVLGSTDHAPAGLMRAVWKLEPGRLGEDTNWNFSAEEAAHIRTRMVRQSTN